MGTLACHWCVGGRRVPEDVRELLWIHRRQVPFVVLAINWHGFTWISSPLDEVEMACKETSAITAFSFLTWLVRKSISSDH